ncbi:HipA domain-containing protein [Phycisphaerales bacterium AB-hyl4]|uniref:HipA domain-containing protein n=1 Tax=Natronomicrosphaera hydrolytica TaxID=3242702 RepID=A0ABV4U5X0_9BACT
MLVQPWITGEQRDSLHYLEFVDELRQHGAAPHADMAMLWRRIVFSVMISNIDDHLRNHGFLYQGVDGWRLAPAYDINAVPVDIKPRVLSTAIDVDDITASLDRALEVAAYFELDHSQTRDIARQIGKAVSTWRLEAARHTVPGRQIDRMATAFEHDDLRAALAL